MSKSNEFREKLGESGFNLLMECIHEYKAEPGMLDVYVKLVADRSGISIEEAETLVNTLLEENTQ